MRVSFNVLIGSKLTFFLRGIHLESESLLDLHLQYLWCKYFQVFGVVLVPRPRPRPRPRLSFSLFFNKTNKSQFFPHLPLVLFFSYSPFSNFQSPKKPKNKIQNKNWLNRNPNPKKKKKKHSDKEDKEARDLDVDEPPCYWFRLAFEPQSWLRSGASWLSVSLYVFTLLLKWVCCSLWVSGWRGLARSGNCGFFSLTGLVVWSFGGYGLVGSGGCGLMPGSCGVGLARWWRDLARSGGCGFFGF